MAPFLDKEPVVPAERIAMRRIREVLRLKHECELSHSQIAQALRVSKGTVSNYLTQAEAARSEERRVGKECRL